MGKPKPKTEKAMIVESQFFKRLRAQMEYQLGPGEYSKRDILTLLDEIYRFI